MRCTLSSVAALFLAIGPLTTLAQVRSFPYEAVVQTSGTPVLSGPGFYATNELQRGARVIVHRHDPGGWFMISPPSGEFSLIRTSDATVADGHAVINVDESFARVGSRLSADFGVEQVPLVKGDRVEVMPGVKAPSGWVAIKPPRGEYRWISGRFLVPADTMTRAAQDADPFAVPSNAARPETFEAVKEEIPTIESPSSASGPTLTLGEPELIKSDAAPDADIQQSLRLLDRELEGLSLSEPTEWPLSKLEAGYKRIASERPSMTRQIDVRLSQIAKMRVVQTHYRDYVQLTSATDERDARLIAKQHNASTGTIMQAAESRHAEPQLTLAPPLHMASKPPAPPSPEVVRETIPSPVNGPQLLAPTVQSQPSTSQSVRPLRPTLPQSKNSVVSGSITRPPVPSPQTVPSTASSNGPQRFGAVGRIQKTPQPQQGGPAYVLVAPNGGIVAYLQTRPGISLDQFIGQPMGVDGERQRHPQLTTPLIAVEQLTPVRF